MNRNLVKHIIFSLLLALLTVSGSAWAQSGDGQFVIKKSLHKKVEDPGTNQYHYEDNGTGHHYLAHVRVGDEYVLQDATTFSPDCLWYSGREISLSGTNHNYYFIDHEGKLRFLSAPLSSDGTLTLSATQPPVYLLNNTDQNYYFYDWDYDNWPEGAGVARGRQHNGVTESTCQYDWQDDQCWQVYWVESKEPTTGNFIWQLSHDHSYSITANSGRFRKVTDTYFDMQVTTTGGLDDLDDIVLETVNSSASPSASVTPFDYIPAYHKYEFNDVKRPNDGNSTPASTLERVAHTYYYPHLTGDNTQPPTSAEAESSGDDSEQWSYNWSISGEGAQYLTLTGGNTASPTLTYSTENNTGHKTATLTLTITYQDGSSQTTACTVTVKTRCQNPQVSANVTYENVVVSWTPTATKYKLEWTLASDASWTSSSTLEDITETSHTFTGLEYNTAYQYRVMAYCGSDYLEPTISGTFTTFATPDAMICGAVFGGGRMANVTGNPEVVIVNCDSISAVYGGNDIAGEVQGSIGSTVVLGVAVGDSYSSSYNSGAASTKVRVMDVYGGGNGYYLYNTTEFDGATTPDVTLPNNATVDDLDGHMVWKNETGADYALTIPKIVKTAIVMAANDFVKVDSIFGGAKNAFITNDDDEANGTSVTVKGGTAFAVYGGNNYGGTQTAGKHYVKVEGTKTNTTTYPTGFGRDFGIAYLFGGGNKVEGKKTNVEITGGMCDTVFGGGNAADVAEAMVTVNCPLAAASSGTQFGNVYSNAISSCTSSGEEPPTYTLNIDEDDYEWNGTGIYNVRTLFGGNNQADMNPLPTITLTSGSVGTVYGGGNSGEMHAQTSELAGNPIATDFGANYIGNTPLPIYYSTHVVIEEDANMLVDYLYGGCQMSNVKYSTWVEVKGGHVGTVYGGCNIGGDVGSTRMSFPDGTTLTNEHKQATLGATYVKASGGTIYGNLFAGANGFYHCNDGVHYTEGHNFTPGHSYIDLEIPTHNETHVKVSGNAIVKGNVYAGGNMACVGFINTTTNGNNYPTFRGLCSVLMDGGSVIGSVYGGGCRASVFGSNEVKVSGGSIGYDGLTPTGGALYGGNDRSGQVAQITNRVFPSANNYDVASDGHTSLKLIGVKTYVGITNKPKVNTVYGGGNGAYQPYDPDEYCDITDQPVQSNTFVDININAQPETGQAQGGHINTVYGGGNGVTVLDRITVFVNVQNATTYAYDHVGTIFGGNNQGDLDILSDIIMLHGQVNTVYGGCNSGAMTGRNDYEDYTDVGSVVQLRNRYLPNGSGTPVVPDAKITGAVYGGCRMNDVTHNSLVLVEGGNHSTANMFGGCDISGLVGGTSQVVVKNGTSTSPVNNSTVVANVYGGGNGDYDYENGTYASLTPPSSANTQVDIESGTVTTGVYGGNNAKGTVTGDVEVNITGGTIGANTSARANVHGGGYGSATTTDGNVTVNIASDGALTGPTINGEVYGGSALGEVSASNKTTTVNFYKGTINGDIYGGGLGDDDNEAEVSGNVEVNIRGGVFNSATGTAGGGCIYGCNNANGTPKGDVFVNIYATDHGEGPVNNEYPDNPPTGYADWSVEALAANTALPQTYAINAVFGGGNRAAYTPAAVESGETPHTTTVHVYSCDNTIKTLYGGGNAADVGIQGGTAANTTLIVDGGRINQLFGGGNGYSQTHNHYYPDQPYYNPGANIYGLASTTVYGGLIDEVYGGANSWGNIDEISLNVSGSGSCGDRVYGKVFGCANEAPLNHSITTTVECGAGAIGELYGGSNLAPIGIGDHTANVTLNLYGGVYDKVFGGSKGTSSVAANIDGSVTLNLFGGTVEEAFGGNDVNGSIAGSITVNVLDVEDDDCPLILTNVYGASNQADYAPENASTIVSPVVNVMHIKDKTVSGDNYPGIMGNVYGGGNQAAVTGNPQVNIGYVPDAVSGETTMGTILNSIKPTGWTEPTGFPRAYVVGNVYGGGNLAPVTGTDTVNIRKANSYVNNVFGGGNQAGTTNSVVNVYDGTVNTNVYGGCNTSGTVTGDIKVNLLDGTVTQDVFGGGQGNATGTNGNITVTVDGSTVGRDVYGGSALGQVNNESTDLTKVLLKSGTITGNLYGGGMGDAGHNDYGQVNGEVEVHVNGGTIGDGNNNTGNVFGCNNTNGQPKSSVKVYIKDETAESTMNINGNIYGGGNVAYCESTCEVYIQNGTINNKVFGGGNNISIDNKGVGGTMVQMTGGTVLGGIYGGCNTDGDVTGNSVVTITGGTIRATGVGNEGYIFGGGYGEPTTVKGNVTVTFGEDSNTKNNYPMLYGDLYGGSALGDVNTNASNNTTVYVYNGTIEGNIFGGGLGDNASLGVGHSNVEAKVNGVVHVNIGKMIAPVEPATEPTFSGLATLNKCEVYGCNNVKGSPQDHVYVDVYSTYRRANDQADVTGTSATYAIQSVFGGGNKAHYAPNSGRKTHVYVHGCDNTSEFLYAGGNAADALGVEIVVEGGRFKEAYGGGNGLLTPANIGDGGIGFNFHGGRYGYTYEGSNRWGTNAGDVNNPEPGLLPAGESVECGGSIVEYHFFGANQAEIYVEVLENTITCEQASHYNFTKVFAGSRWAIIYGDVKLTVGGGTIMNLFGGSQGYSNFSADIRKYPTPEQIAADVAIPHKYSDDLRAYMLEHPERAGQGGNVTLVITGGSIGEIYGGCDVNGNVEGEITVIIADDGNGTCAMEIGDVYGASNEASYAPKDNTTSTPKVAVLKGELGMQHDFNNDGSISALETFDGNVYGGGNKANITGSPKVIVGDGTTGPTASPVTIKGSVYGGGNIGNVEGSPQVVVVPDPNHTLTIGTPAHGTIATSHVSGTSLTIGEDVAINMVATPDENYAFDSWSVTGTNARVSYPKRATTVFTMGTSDATITAVFKPAHTLTITSPANGHIEVTDSHGIAVNTGDKIGEGMVLTIKAIPANASSSEGYVFNEWSVTGATPANASLATTTITMGTSDVVLTTNFVSANVHTLTVTGPDGAGTYKIRMNGDEFVSPVYVAEGASVYVLASPAEGYGFNSWAVSGSGTVNNSMSAGVTFTMGNADATLTASYLSAPVLTMTANPVEKGTFKVNGVTYTTTQSVMVPQGASTTVEALPIAGYAFSNWAVAGAGASVASTTVASTTFTMGSAAATLTATFVPAHWVTISSGGHGSVTATDSNSNPVSNTTSMGEGATLNLTPVPETGYHFKEWTVTGTGSSVSENIFTMGTANATLTATFEQNEP